MLHLSSSMSAFFAVADRGPWQPAAAASWPGADSLCCQDLSCCAIAARAKKTRWYKKIHSWPQINFCPQLLRGRCAIRPGRCAIRPGRCAIRPRRCAIRARRCASTQHTYSTRNNSNRWSFQRPGSWCRTKKKQDHAAPSF